MWVISVTSKCRQPENDILVGMCVYLFVCYFCCLEKQLFTKVRCTWRSIHCKMKYVIIQGLHLLTKKRKSTYKRSTIYLFIIKLSSFFAVNMLNWKCIQWTDLFCCTCAVDMCIHNAGKFVVASWISLNCDIVRCNVTASGTRNFIR